MSEQNERLNFIGDKASEGTTLNNMATTAHARGDYERALASLAEDIGLEGGLTGWARLAQQMEQQDEEA